MKKNTLSRFAYVPFLFGKDDLGVTQPLVAGTASQNLMLSGTRACATKFRRVERHRKQFVSTTAWTTFDVIGVAFEVTACGSSCQGKVPGKAQLFPRKCPAVRNLSEVVETFVKQVLYLQGSQMRNLTGVRSRSDFNLAINQTLSV